MTQERKLPVSPYSDDDLKALYKLIAEKALKEGSHKTLFQLVKTNLLKFFSHSFDNAVNAKLAIQIELLIPILFLSPKDSEDKKNESLSVSLTPTRLVAQEGSGEAKNKEMKSHSIVLNKNIIVSIIKDIKNNGHEFVFRRIMNGDRERFKLDIRQIDQQLLNETKADKAHFPFRMATGGIMGHPMYDFFVVAHDELHEESVREQKATLESLQSLENLMREIYNAILKEKNIIFFILYQLMLPLVFLRYGEIIAKINPYKAIEVIKLAMDICNENFPALIIIDRFKRSLAAGYLQIARIQSAGNTQEALVNYEQVSRIYVGIVNMHVLDHLFHIESLLSAAKIYFDRKSFIKVIEKIEEAFEVIQELPPNYPLPDSFRLADFEKAYKIALFHQIQFCISQDNHDEALDLLDRFNKLLIYVIQDKEMSEYYQNMSDMLFEYAKRQEDLTTKIDFLNRAIESLRWIGPFDVDDQMRWVSLHRELGLAYSTLAQEYYNNNDLTEAVEFYNDAYQAFSNIPSHLILESDKENIAFIQYNLANAYYEIIYEFDEDEQDYYESGIKAFQNLDFIYLLNQSGGVQKYFKLLSDYVANLCSINQLDKAEQNIYRAINLLSAYAASCYNHRSLFGATQTWNAMFDLIKTMERVISTVSTEDLPADRRMKIEKNLLLMKDYCQAMKSNPQGFFKQEQHGDFKDSPAPNPPKKVFP